MPFFLNIWNLKRWTLHVIRFLKWQNCLFRPFLWLSKNIPSGNGDELAASFGGKSTGCKRRVVTWPFIITNCYTDADNGSQRFSCCGRENLLLSYCFAEMDKREIREVCIRFSSIFVLVNRDEGMNERMVNQGNTFTTWLPMLFW